MDIIPIALVVLVVGVAIYFFTRKKPAPKTSVLETPSEPSVPMTPPSEPSQTPPPPEIPRE